MADKHLYIIAGCNGAGKTTASMTILPKSLLLKEFVNADEIARGLSPFNPGHGIPIETIQRRYLAGIDNMFKLYMNEVDIWSIYDNSEQPRELIAYGGKDIDTVICNKTKYERIKKYVK